MSDGELRTILSARKNETDQLTDAQAKALARLRALAEEERVKGLPMSQSLRKRLDAVQRTMTATSHGARIKIVYDPNFYGNAEQLERLAPGWIQQRFPMDGAPQRTREP